MKSVFDVKEMRAGDRELMERRSIGEVALVERVAEALAAYAPREGKVCVVAGRGNNGADGLALATILAASGLAVDVRYIEGNRSEACAYYFAHLDERVGRKAVQADERIEGYDVVFDCVLGTGFRGAPEGAAAWAIEAINRSGAYVVSIDIAGGLNADNGMAVACVKSDLTLAIGGLKSGNLLNMAKDTYRRLEVIDIGIDERLASMRLVEESDAVAAMPARSHFSNKGDYGYIALVGGSLPYSGAVRLAALAAAAMRAGAGVAKVATVGSLCPLLVPHVLESTLFPLSEEGGAVRFVEGEIKALIKNVKSVAFGMGIGTGNDAKEILLYLLANYEGRLIVDADGLTLLAALDRETVRAHKGTLILTPHVKELSRLSGYSVADIFDQGVGVACEYARSTGAVVLYKGPTTVVTDGLSTVLVAEGAPGMATAGSGDVLSGVLAATAAYVEDAFAAVWLAAYINGKAGEMAAREMGDVSMVASDTVAKVAAVCKRLTEK